MIDHRLILVEGLSGSGKSTTAHHLFLRLLQLGQSVRWFYSHHQDHPVMTLDPRRTIEDLQQSLSRWESFVRDLRSEETVVLDAIVQTTVYTHQILSQTRRLDVYAGFMNRAIKAAAPCLVYLRQPSVEDALARTRAVRGPQYDRYVLALLNDPAEGEAAVLPFFKQHRDLTDRFLSLLDIPRIEIDPSTVDWYGLRQMVGQFLGVPEWQPRYGPVDGAERLAGSYLETSSGDELVIAAQGDSLVIDNSQRTRLIPKNGGSAFYVEGLCAEIDFADDALTITGALPGLPPHWRKRERPGRREERAQ